MTSDGIEPPLSDLESEVLPLHHEAPLAEPGAAAAAARWIGSRVAQWSARWAHNPQVVGSKPTSAIIFPLRMGCPCSLMDKALAS